MSAAVDTAIAEVQADLQKVSDAITLKEAEVIGLRSEQIIMGDALKKLEEARDLLAPPEGAEVDMDDTEEFDETQILNQN